MRGDAAQAYAASRRAPTPAAATAAVATAAQPRAPATVQEPERSTVGPTRGVVSRARWTGDLPPLQWMKLYQKVLTPFVSSGAVKLSLTIDLAPTGGLTQHQLEELRAQLEALGLSTRIDTES